MALVNLVLFGMFLSQIRFDAAHASSGQIDPSPFPYFGAAFVASASAFSASAAVALRLAPGAAWARLLHEIATHAAVAGVVVGTPALLVGL